MPEEERYRIAYLDIKEKRQLQELIRKLASEERIGLDEYVFKDNKGYGIVNNAYFARKETI